MDKRYPKKYAPKKVFVLENNEYIEISYEELCERTKLNSVYASKLFLPLHGMLMEVTENVYREFYKEERHQKYLMERGAENRDISYDSLSIDEMERMRYMVDANYDVEDTVLDKVLIEAILRALPLLSDEEQTLIHQYYYDELSESQLGRLYGVSQQAISKRLQKIQQKIKKMLKT